MEDFIVFSDVYYIDKIYIELFEPNDAFQSAPHLLFKLVQMFQVLSSGDCQGCRPQVHSAARTLTEAIRFWSDGQMEKGFINTLYPCLILEPCNELS